MSKAFENQYTVDAAQSQDRLDTFLKRVLPEMSRTFLQREIQSAHILLNGQPSRPRQLVQTGDVITVKITPPAKKSTPQAEAIDLDFLYEDDSLAVIDKAPCIAVHPGAGNEEGTLVHALLHHCESLSTLGGEDRAGIVHRLDKETSGALVIAKTDRAHRNLADQFKDRSVKKTYLAVVHGIARDTQGRIEGAIARHPTQRIKRSVQSSPAAKAATTDYRVLGAEQGNALVLCQPITGRTHQIRVHLHHIGHPILGDPLYGKTRESAPRTLLHAWKLAFSHPESGEWMEFCAPLPPDFPQWTRALVEAEKEP